MSDLSEIESEDLQEKIISLPSVEYDKSIGDAPYSVYVNTQQLASLLKEFGMSNDDTTNLHIVLGRKVPSRTGAIGGVYEERPVPTIYIGFDHIWNLYQEYLKLSQDIISKRKNPNKDQFKDLLYTKKLPEYLTKAPPERGLQFAQKLLLNGLAREQNMILLHETGHILDAKFRPKLLGQTYGPVRVVGSLLGAVGSITGGVLNSAELMALAMGTLIVSTILDTELLYGSSPREQSASKFANSLKNNPNWRSIVTIGPKTAPQPA